MEIVVAATPDDVAALGAQWIARRIRSAVRLRGCCRIAVSGGTTPVRMFDALATMQVPWGHVSIFQVDERVAPDGDPARNATQLAEHLLRHVEIHQGDQYLMPVTATDLTSAAVAYAALVSCAPFDIVHLGLGDDGHTASWPPGDAVVNNPNAVALTEVFNGRVRMTMTRNPVNGARRRLVQACGVSKSQRVAEWLLGADLPIQAVRRVGTTVMLDEAAAALLPPSTLTRR